MFILQVAIGSPWSALTLAFLLGSASAEKGSIPHTNSSQDLFFYHHIPKTGGTSWSIDIAKLRSRGMHAAERPGPLRHCGSSHVGPGPWSSATLNRTLRNRLAYSKQDSQTRCNLFNREESLQASLRIFASQGVTPKLILMLRSPVTHAASAG